MKDIRDFVGVLLLGLIILSTGWLLAGRLHGPRPAAKGSGSNTIPAHWTFATHFFWPR